MYSSRPHKLTAHRALDDIRESVAELAFYKQNFLRPQPSEPGTPSKAAE